jgi:hypothetical protein
MTVTTIVPDGTISNTGWTVVGAANAQTALTDGNDATYLEAGSGGGDISLTLGTFSIPAGSYVKDFTLVERGYVSNPSGAVRIIIPYLYPTTSGTSKELPGDNTWWTGSFIVNQNAGGFGAAFTGVMTQTELDALAVRLIATTQYDGSLLRLADLDVLVTTRVIPTVTGASIAFGAGGLKPKITWTTVNPDFELVWYRAKVFTAAQAADIFFDADATPAVWDSGEVFSGSTAPSGSQITTSLVGGVSYVVALKVGAQTGWTKSGGNPTGTNPPKYVTDGVWRLSGTLQANIVAPARPYMTLTDEPNNVVGGPRVKIDVYTQDNMLRRGESLDINGLAAYNWFPQDANTTLAEVAAGSPFFGANVIRMTRNTSTGDALMQTDYGGATVSSVQSTWLRPVVAGRTYAAFANVKSAATARTARVEVDWFNASGTFLSTSNVGSITTSTTLWKVIGGSVVAPANAAFMRMGVRVLAAIATEQHYVLLPIFRPYDNGDAITDGALHPAGAGFSSLGNILSGIDSSGELNGGLAYNSDWINQSSFPTSGATVFRQGARSWLSTSVAAGNTHFLWSRLQKVVGQNRYGLIMASRLAGNTFYVQGWARADAVAGLQAFAGIQFYDASNNQIGTVYGSLVTTNTSTFVKIDCLGVAPTNAVYVSPIFGFIATGVTQSMWFDTMGLHQTVNAPWNPGGVNEAASGVETNNDTMQRVLKVERSDDSGVTWRKVRNIWYAPPTGTSEPQTITAYDYEVVNGRQAQYRASTVAWYMYDEFQSDFYTASITPAATTSGTDPKRWWLKDPLDPTKSMQVDLLQDSFHYKETEAQAMYDPLGRNRNIIVADVVYGKEITATLDFLVEAEYDAFTALRRSQRTLLLQRPWNNDSWFVRIRDAIEVNEFNTTPIRYQIDLEMVEVDVP